MSKPSTVQLAHDSHGGGAGHDGGAHHHILPLPIYLGVYGALLVLTVVTVGVSFAGLGALSLPVAIAVALVKAGFVIGYFMHLRYDVRMNTMVFMSSVLFLAIFFGLTMLDLMTRGGTDRQTDTFVYQQETEYVLEMNAAAEAAAAGAPAETGAAAEEHGAEH
jgi:cytochrome c oxidase subunit 4